MPLTLPEPRKSKIKRIYYSRNGLYKTLDKFTQLTVKERRSLEVLDDEIDHLIQ